MKSIKTFLLISLLGLGLNVIAQTSDTTTTPPEPPTDTPKVEKPGMPEAIKIKLEEFRKAQAEFQAKQKELVEAIKNATPEQKEQVREAMREAVQKIQDQRATVRQEMKDRMVEMRKQFKENRDKILQEAKEKAKERKGQN